MLFSPTIGAAIAARYWYLWVRCPGLPHHAVYRLARARSSPGRRRNQSHSRVVMPLVPPECAVRGIGPPVAD
jgi:hypothetical protein